MHDQSIVKLSKNVPNPNWFADMLWLTLICSGLFFIALGSRPLFTPDEGRYAEIGREMALSGNFITPYLNTIKYFEKPALFYWLTALALKIGGVNVWSVRMVNAILATLCCLFTYFSVRQLFNRQTAWFAALILSTSLLFFVMTRMVTLDLPVTVFLTSTLYAFLLGIQQINLGKSGRFWFWTAAISASCAVLTKGLIGIVFPGMIVLSWLLLTKQLRLLTKFHLTSSLFIFFILVAPWHILVSLKNPGFLQFYFIEQHILRYTTPGVGHLQPVWYFVPILFLALLPWGFFLIQSLIFTIKEIFHNKSHAVLFILVWAGFIFIFFSFSKSKLIPYILPIVPPVAILIAHYLQTQIQQFNRKGIQLGLFCLLIASLLFTIQGYFLSHYLVLSDVEKTQYWMILGGGILTIGVTISILLSYSRLRTSVYVLFPAVGIFLLTLMLALPYMQTRSILPLANYLKPILKPTDTVVAYNQYFQDLPFYLQRRISILNWRNELSYGMKNNNVSEFMLNDQSFWHQWQSKNRLFVILSKDELQEVIKNRADVKFITLASTIKYVLITNQKIK